MQDFIDSYVQGRAGIYAHFGLGDLNEDIVIKLDCWWTTFYGEIYATAPGASRPENDDACHEAAEMGGDNISEWSEGEYVLVSVCDNGRDMCWLLRADRQITEEA